MRSEGDIPCSRRLTALIVFILIVLAGRWSAEGLEIQIQVQGNISGIPKGQILELFQVSAQKIAYLTGLDTDFPVRVLVYQNPYEYLREGLPAWSVAAYRNGVIHFRDPLLFARYRTLQEVITHELLHALISYRSVSLPFWFEEGLAQVVSQGTDFSDFSFDYCRVDRETVFYYRETQRVLTELVDRYGWVGIRHFFVLMNDYPFAGAFRVAFPLETSIPDIFLPLERENEVE
ncbi:MAG TPA: hypothetical protein VLH40_10260 [Atribacteraceae bacterium]|nr:hypothetical protein [Atribacteraceae bacterium]